MKERLESNKLRKKQPPPTRKIKSEGKDIERKDGETLRKKDKKPKEKGKKAKWKRLTAGKELEFEEFMPKLAGVANIIPMNACEM